MRKGRMFFYVCAGALCLAATVVVAAIPTVGAKLAPGNESYSPSTLEWAAVEMNAIAGSDEWGAGKAVSSKFQAGNDGVTLRCLLRYRAAATSGNAQEARRAIQDAVERYGRSRGWSWIKVTFDEMVE